MSFDGFRQCICPICNRNVATAHYNADEPILLLEGGSKFPDYLQFCGAGRNVFVISENALNLFEQHKVSGYSAYQAIQYRVLKGKPLPNRGNIIEYYCLELNGKVDLDLPKMQLRRKKFCQACKQFDWSRQRLGPLALQDTSWDGSDLCYLKSIPGYKFCTDYVREIVRKNKLTGFKFVDI